MVVLRLQKIGKKGQAQFRLLAQDKRKDPQDKSLEILGFLNPHTKESKFKEERVKYWLAQGAQPTATVHNLLIDKNILSTAKVKTAKLKKTVEVAAPVAAAPAEVVESAPAA